VAHTRNEETRAPSLSHLGLGDWGRGENLERLQKRLEYAAEDLGEAFPDVMFGAIDCVPWWVLLLVGHLLRMACVMWKLRFVLRKHPVAGHLSP
jgi:hypothetical protein